MATRASDPVAWGLPHREPFIFIDAVGEVVAGESARCTVTFPPDAPFFRGHFPGDPVVPGVLLTEALAQTAGIAAGRPGAAYRLSAVKMMKFLEPVRPGETVHLSARKTVEAGGLIQFDVVAEVAGRKVAAGALVLNRALEPGISPAPHPPIA